MHISGIARYPIKGLPGESLSNARLTRGYGVPGDRRFAFGIDATKDDGTWYSSRNYLINSRKDNLLKFAQRCGQGAWEITSPSGHVLQFDANDPASIARANMQLGSFLSCVENDGKTACLIDRNPDDGPKGHWDFPDTELLVVNLCTLHELERHWGIEIDPRRFRANLLIDGLPAWSEFGLFGAEYAVGGAKIEFLRPARRCPAISVNPTTGDRDAALQNDLTKDFGHGFLGVYARVSQSGNVGVGDAMHRTDAAGLASRELTCDLAPEIARWPKAAKVTATDAPDVFAFKSVGSLALADAGASGRMKIHLKPGKTLSGEIVASSRQDVLSVRLKQGADVDCALLGANDFVLLTGPFGR